MMLIYWSNISRHQLNLGRKWVFQIYNDTKHTSKVVAKWLKDNKVKELEWPSTSSDRNPIENKWAELKNRVRARRPTNLTWLHQLCQEEWAKIHPTYCGKLVEGARNIWPKLNNLKAMLPNTNWVYVNFWPTGNVMKEIKREINHFERILFQGTWSVRCHNVLMANRSGQRWIVQL